MRLSANISLWCILALLAACQQDPFAYISRPDGGASDGAGGDAIAPDGTTDAKPDAKGDGICKPTGGETCDGVDNDCNGKVDDVDPTKLQSDPSNCGKCGTVCSFINAYPVCENGVCKLDYCAPGFYDVNQDVLDGCEYQCTLTNSGVEECGPSEPDCACDNKDNDCDGEVDEPFDLTSDVNNCGSCGNKCLYNHATGVCASGACQMGACDAGYADLNTSDKDGCESMCPVWPPIATDDCDGTDNDCDGQVDEDFAPSSCGTGVGECAAGTNDCVAGTVVCKGGSLPQPEICDNKDNDCDGSTDEDFDKLNDPRYCGQSCVECKFAHAIASCVNGVCGIAVCETGWVDLDKNVATGCEYPCTLTGAEICDGLDNDCNGKIDGADPGMAAPTGICYVLGACTTASPSCKGTLGWSCNYSGDVELKACTTDTDCLFGPCTNNLCQGEVISEETRCDGVDNDCDGLVDETHPAKGTTCAEQGKLGVCQGTGSWVCNTAGTGVNCVITSPGTTASDELCNGLDDDCDGLVDEEADDTAGKGVVDAMIHVQRDGYNFWIYTYEASRPDAGATKMGQLTSRACSKSGVIPWSNLNFNEANAACQAAGKRLCTATEWLVACSGAPNDPTGCTTAIGDGCIYPYGDAYTGNTCNGQNYASPNTVLATGAATGCKSPDGAFDMSGNLKEWTNDPRSDGSPPDPDGYTVRGGSYDSSYFGLRCDFDFAVMPPSFYYVNLGFRCCSNGNQPP